MKEYDIAIVGGGLVGASLACAMRESGLRLAVIETRPPPLAWKPRYDDRTLALAYGSRRIFEGMGVWRTIAQRGATPIERIHISDRGRFGITRLSAREAGLEALGYVVEMPALGNALYESLHGYEAVQWYGPAVMQALAVDPEAVSVSVRQGDGSHAISARLVVGADGGRSKVRAAAGMRARTRDYGQTAVVANVTPSRPHHNVAYERFTETGPLALLPMRDNRCTVVWSARHEQIPSMLAWDDTEYLRQLQIRFGQRLGAFDQAGRRSHYPLALTRLEAHARARLVLVGNAAHTVHPVAGQGFNLGLRDVAALAEILVTAARAGRDIGDVTLLTRYAHARRSDMQAVTAFTDGLIRIFANSFGPLVVARNLGLIATDLLPPLKRGLVRRRSGLAGPLPRLARGLPL